MKLGIIGCGAIGSTLAKAAEEMEEVMEIYLFDKSHTCSRAMAARLSKVKPALTIEELIDNSDMIIEAASQEAVRLFASEVLGSGRDMMIMSVGAFVDDDFRQDLEITAKNNGSRIYLPTGAVCGIDGVTSAVASELEEVQLCSRKPPSAFESVPYLKEKHIELNTIDSPTVLFDGNAREAVKLFPKNINVAATVSLAGIGFERTKVKIIADPNISENRHMIVAKGKFGTLKAEVSNLPSEKNPKTSQLAALSAISALKRIVSGWWVGV